MKQTPLAETLSITNRDTRLVPIIRQTHSTGRTGRSSTTHSELGDFLRSRREKLSAQTMGLPTARRRRTPGLRREEVAHLAGIGVDWYVRMEQGRAVNPSAATVDALAAALCLSQTEHVHLRALAHGPNNKLFGHEVVPPTVLRVVQAVAQPAYITGRRWDVLAWNRAAEAIFDFSKVPEADRNILVFMLTLASSRRLFGPGWAAEAQRMVAEFRAAHDLWAGEPAFSSLLRRLRQGCPEFNGWWDAHDVRSAVAGHKVLYHPTKGLLGFDYAAFQVNDNPTLKLVIYLQQQNL